jgi:hypothetical protein
MAQGNFSESVGKPLEVFFEASGLSFDDAERFAATFKPSWEFDEAPFTDGGGVHANHIDALADGGVHADIASPPDSRTVPPRAPPPRAETHEPEVSVIIDRSIVAAELQAAPRPAQAARPVAVAPSTARSFGAPAPQRAQQRIAPVLSSRADESLGLPSSLRKSNKGLFIGVGVAVVAAGLVFAVHGVMTPDSDSAASTSTSTSATAPAPTTTVTTPAAVPVAAVTAAPPSAPSAGRPAAAPAAAPVVPAAVSAPTPAPVQHSAPAPRPAPHASAVHHGNGAPKNPPKPAAGGIVRDAPF